jgi:hypothetical protein
MSENTVNVALKRLGYEDRLTGHGIRATISTALNELGYPKVCGTPSSRTPTPTASAPPTTMPNT